MRKILLSLLLLPLLLLASPARADQLNINAQTGTTYTFANTDCSKLVTFNNAANVAATLPQASGPTGTGSGLGTFMPPCVIKVANIGSAYVTITPTTSTIGGASSLVLAKNTGADIISDGTNYRILNSTGVAD